MPPVRMSYRAVGSSTGQYEFLGNTNASRQQETYVRQVSPSASLIALPPNLSPCSPPSPVRSVASVSAVTSSTW